MANALEVIGQTENRYSGIPTIKHAMEEAGLQSSKFESTYGVFRVTLYNAIAKKEEPLTPFQQSILDFCTRPRTRGELEERLKDDITIAYLMTKHIFPMVKRGLLKLTIPDKPKSKNQQFVTVRP